MKLLQIEEFKNGMMSEGWPAIPNALSRLEKFYELWMLEEGVLKGDDRGLSLPLPNVHVEGKIVRV